MTMRVRFAPSNTGTLHIGGARTALYNWLWARKNKGTFLLRIEDTDLERSKSEYTDNILSSLKWLGIDWDEGPEKGGPHGPYFQTERAKAGLYKPFIDKLMAGGGVYRCFCSKERLASLKVHDENAPYDRKCRSIPRDEADKRARAGESNVIRIKLPEAAIRFQDGIKGPQSWDPAVMSDEIIIRGDGSPMYNFVVVCDDLAMGVTDVIRGEDHLSNTPKQVAIYGALGATMPRFAHIPLIFGPNGKKLSKRAPVLRGKNKKGEEVYVAQSKDDPNAWEVLLKGQKSVVPKAEITDLSRVMSQVDEYREAGYLPQAVLNYLVLLGWGYDDKTEFFTKDDLVEKFDLKKVSSSAAQFDPVKLEHFQGLHMKAMDPAVIAAKFADELHKAGVLPATPSPEDKARLEILARAERERIKFFREIVDRARIYFVDQVEYDAKAIENLKKRPDAARLLRDYADALEAKGNFDDPKALEEQARAFSTEKAVKFGELVHPVRAALTGTTQGLGLFEVVRLCGKKRALERLRRAADYLGNS
ncbi:MAG TPA: glutamate--tRNA ligase [Planctomycetota bacterium]|nr:glutamate--tRNA ligase [Planctomycetota bacterium]